MLSSCLLYSCRRFTCTSKMDLGSTSTPLCSRIYFARRSLFLYLISINSLSASLSSAHFFSPDIRDRSVAQSLVPSFSVTQSDSSGLPCIRNRLWVIPLVLLLNFCGIIDRK